MTSIDHVSWPLVAERLAIRPSEGVGRSGVLRLPTAARGVVLVAEALHRPDGGRGAVRRRGVPSPHAGHRGERRDGRRPVPLDLRRLGPGRGPGPDRRGPGRDRVGTGLGPPGPRAGAGSRTPARRLLLRGARPAPGLRHVLRRQRRVLAPDGEARDAPRGAHREGLAAPREGLARRVHLRAARGRVADARTTARPPDEGDGRPRDVRQQAVRPPRRRCRPTGWWSRSTGPTSRRAVRCSRSCSPSSANRW